MADTISINKDFSAGFIRGRVLIEEIAYIRFFWQVKNIMYPNAEYNISWNFPCFTQCLNLELYCSTSGSIF